MTSCISCNHFGLCAPDCPIAPWNDDVIRKPAPSPLAYLLRQRRWARWPVHRRDTWFKDSGVRTDQQRRFFG